MKTKITVWFQPFLIFFFLTIHAGTQSPPGYDERRLFPGSTKALSAESALLQRREVSLLVLQQTVVNGTTNAAVASFSATAELQQMLARLR